jgi:hypothetical protein
VRARLSLPETIEIFLQLLALGLVETTIVSERVVSAIDPHR